MRKTGNAIVDITLCDVNASELCVVTFGIDPMDNMVINFQLPDADYPLFYVKAANRGNVNTYPCEVITDEPTSVYCSGTRAPLGESIDMEVYTTDGDKLLARGKFLVSALMRVTPNPQVGTPTPTPGPTSIPPTPYPNP
ncbi:MAG: hypothetical protein HY863_02995 [Chloroflexi bacterium]|nr:hypothetical protein [Chloroflexota bacterium]